MSNSNDSFVLEKLLKEVADAWNESIEQAERAATCKMRRFSRIAKVNDKEDALGVVFPDGTVVLQEYVTGNLSIYDDIKHIKTATHYFQWIDAEPRKS